MPARFVDELVTAAAASAPGSLALVAGDTARGFGELEARAAQLAGALQDLAAPGDRVAILAENRAEYVECYFAVPRAGLLLAPLHHRLRRDDWLAALTRLEPSVLVVEPAYLEALGADAARRAGVRTIVRLLDDEPNAPAGPGVAGGAREATGADVELEELVASGGSRRRPVRRSPDDVAWLVATSGTTDTPKHAMLTHASLLAAVEATRHARPVGEDDVLLTTFSLGHVAGYTVLVFFSSARPVIVARRFDVEAVLAAIPRYRVTQLSLAPTMLEMLLGHPALARADLGSLRAIGYGASPIPADVLRRTVERLPVDVSQGYGMTELSGNAVFLGPEAHRRAASGNARLLAAAGRPAPGVELRIVDDALRDVEPGVTGEILVRAPQMMAGYWRDPEATAATIVDGWLRTGDLGFVDAEGDLHVVDRVKDVIVTGGENVVAREVEDVLRTHPAVSDAAVVGRPDRRWGERVCAVVVPVDGQRVEVDALVAHCRAHLATFMAPREVVVVDTLPRNATGKVLKRELRARLADSLASGSGPRRHA